MKASSKFLAAAGVVALSLAAADAAQAASHSEKEKCYGVAKKGQNDCGSLDGSHSCAGQAAQDNDPKEWIFVPKGLCERLAGGTTKG